MVSPPKPRKGRGAISNPEGRFESLRVTAVDDGWTNDTDAQLPPLATTVTAEHAKSIISRNDSPDIPFEQSINPYRGCGHGCVYCLSGDTDILLASGRTRLLGDLKIGDEIIGTARHGLFRCYVKTRVLAHWATRKRAYRLLLANGTTITASADHRFLSDRGWKFVAEAAQGQNPRAHLTTGDRLLGVGMPTDLIAPTPVDRRGYHCGVVRNRHRAVRAYVVREESTEMAAQFHLALADGAALQGSSAYLQDFAVQVRAFILQTATSSALGGQSPRSVQVIEKLTAWPRFTPAQWSRGFPGGIFDAAGSYTAGIVGQSVASGASLDIVEIKSLGNSMPMYDITTGTGDFIANGVVSHNCYARPAHSYVNLSPGLDFETKLFYKENAAELLRQELSRPSYVCKVINLGANTDPYQPIERKLKVTRSILEVLQKFQHPVTIITKGNLIERDIDILAAMARDNLASVHVSVTTLDANLKRILEPRAPAASVRLQAIRCLHAAGIPVGALVAPVIPAINDHEIEHILAAVAQAGAQSAAFVMLRLPYEVKDLFREWLAEHYPLRAARVMSLVNDLRGGRDNDPRFGTRMRGTGPLADLVRRRFEVACRKLNLNTARRAVLDTRLYRVPAPSAAQLDLGL